jgi:hypothetical protein
MSWPTSITEGENHSDSMALQEGGSCAVSHGTQQGITYSSEDTIGRNIGEASHEMASTAHTKTRGRSRGEVDSESVTDSAHWSSSNTESNHWSDAQSWAASWHEQQSVSQGTHNDISYSLPAFSGGFPDEYTYANGVNAMQAASSGTGGMQGASHVAGGSSGHTETMGGARALSSGHATSFVESEGEGEMRGTSRGRSQSRALQRSRSQGEAVNFGESEQVTEGTNWSTTEQHTDGTSYAISRGRTPSVSEEQGWSASHTLQPLGPDEQQLLHIQRLKEIPNMHFALKVPGVPVVFVRAPWVETPTITRRILEAGLARVYTLPYYTRLEQHGGTVVDVEAREVQQSASVSELLAPEVLPPTGSTAPQKCLPVAEPTTFGQTRRPRV